MLGREERGEAVLGHRVEQPALVTEHAVDRGWLNACRDRDGAGGDGVPPLARQQTGRRLDDPLPGLRVCIRIGAGSGSDTGSSTDVGGCTDTAAISAGVGVDVGADVGADTRPAVGVAVDVAVAVV